MLKRWSLKEQNRGASLIAILVALIFVGIMGMLIAQITITNIQLKEAERASKTNFYSAEEIMDDLTSGLNNKAAYALDKAYNEALSSYRNAMMEGVALQKEFTKIYLDSLEALFEDASADKHVAANATYTIGRYKRDMLAQCFSCFDANFGSGMSAEEITAFRSKMTGYLDTEPASPAYHLDYTNGTFTLKDVGIRFADASGYETHITTDIVFHTPEINFTGSNVIKDFMRYSLIADTQIAINAPNITVDGNAYAGHKGIVAYPNGKAVFRGNTVVTRGDVEAQSGSDLTIGQGNTKLWAENIKTTAPAGIGSPSKLTLNGNFYISDDLSMDGDTLDNPATAETEESVVKVTGNYYGYNFQKDYLDVLKNDSAAYNSAMMINGKNSRLDLTDVNYLLLSGRTYISRGSFEGSSNQDIMLGESLGIRSNQLAYYVPKAFVHDTGADIGFTSTGITEFAKHIHMDGYTTEIQNWLHATKPLVAYHYQDEHMETCYYLNFKDEQSANDFFAAYTLENRNAIEGYAEEYVGNSGLVLNDSVILTLKGNILYRAENVDGGAQDASIYDKHVTIEGGDWGKDGIYFSYANRLAMTYKGLQMYLEENRDDITAADVRFANNDKTLQPLMRNLLDVDMLKNNLASKAEFKDERIAAALADGKSRVIVLIDNASTNTCYAVPTAYTEGIILATGDVRVDNTFNGMIIAGGTISFAANASVSSDEILISQMFSQDMAGLFDSGNPFFAFYFKDYDTFSESVIGMIEIERFTTYEDWTKTEE